MPPLSSALVESFGRHSWPGNVRELRNAVERAVILGDPELEQHCVQPRRRARFEAELDLPYREARDRLLVEFRRAYGSCAIERGRGNLTEAARRWRVNRNTLMRMLEADGSHETAGE